MALGVTGRFNAHRWLTLLRWAIAKAIQKDADDGIADSEERINLGHICPFGVDFTSAVILIWRHPIRPRDLVLPESAAVGIDNQDFPAAIPQNERAGGVLRHPPAFPAI